MTGGEKRAFSERTTIKEEGRAKDGGMKSPRKSAISSNYQASLEKESKTL